MDRIHTFAGHELLQSPGMRILYSRVGVTEPVEARKQEFHDRKGER